MRLLCAKEFFGFHFTASYAVDNITGGTGTRVQYQATVHYVHSMQTNAITNHVIGLLWCAHFASCKLKRQPSILCKRTKVMPET